MENNNIIQQKIDTVILGTGLPLKKFIQDQYSGSIYNVLKKLNKESPTYEKDFKNCEQFFQHNIDRGAHYNDLIIDLFDTLLYPQNDKYSYIMRRLINYLNYTTIIPKEDKTILIECLNHVKEGGDLIIGINHKTYINPGILIMYFIELSIISQKELVKNIYTPIGPFAATNKSYRHGLQGISNIYKTYPQTSNGIIKGLEREQNVHNGKYFKEMLGLFLQDQNLGNHNGNIGKITIMAPTGSGDTTIYHGKEKHIYFVDDKEKSPQGTIKMMDKLSNGDNTKILLIGMNEGAIYDKNKYYQPRIRNQNIYIKVRDITEDKKRLIQEGKIMSSIADLVVDKNGNSIATATSNEKLQELKEQSKQTSQTK